MLTKPKTPLWGYFVEWPEKMCEIKDMLRLSGGGVH